MNLKQHRITGTVAAAVIGLGTLGAAAVTIAGSASAATPAVTATTQLVNRDVIGGHGTPWAKVTESRVLTLTFLGKSKDPAHAAAPFMYSAVVRDAGTERNIPGKFAPDQGGNQHGKKEKAVQVSGPESGVIQWNLFYASTKAHSGLVPTSLNGALNNSYPDVTWPTLAFTPSTHFAGLTEGYHDYTYKAVPVYQVIKGKNVLTGYKQVWENASWNGAGQVGGAKNQIIGLGQ